MNKLKNDKRFKLLKTLICVIIAAFIQAFVIIAFIRPSNLLSSGFTGVAILIEKITSTYFHFSFDTSLGMILLNVPVALICYKNISPKFTFFSLLEVFLASLFLKILNFEPIFNDLLLNVVFGGFIYGIGVTIALKGNASTGGTDFIALYISNKKGKSIWSYIFVFNTCLLIVFGAMFGWEYAGYSILFQFISTKTIDSFYHRYVRMTLQITTSLPDEIINVYMKTYRHGLSRVDGIGGYSKKQLSVLHTVVSSYEVEDIVSLMREVDEHVIINVMKTENFYGGFYMEPID